MKRTLGIPVAVMMLFSLLMFSGCAGRSMNDSMDGSMDTMTEEKMDSGMGSMQESTMQDNGMEKSMETVK